MPSTNVQCGLWPSPRGSVQTIYSPDERPRDPSASTGVRRVLGVKWEVLVPGTIHAIRYWKSPGDTANTRCVSK